MAQELNQFRMTAEKGQLTLDQNWATLNAQVSTNEAGTLAHGQAVLIEDAAGAQIPVIKATAADDAIFGFVTYNVRTDAYVAEENVKIAKRGDVMRMEASAAIARGASVEVVIAGNKVATQTTGTVVGTALDKAAADGDLIRVLIEV
tara:strand:+ start:761 stop:1201 length:441 start_codon:yes stop_codon:yes gene_type:complete